MRIVDTVLFDLDDTLHEDSVAYKRAALQVAEEVVAARGGDARQLFLAYVAEANGFWKKLSSEHLALGIHDARTQLWFDALASVGLADRELAERCAHDYTSYRTAVLRLFPGAADLLIALRARGCKLGIVTNGFAATHHTKIDALGLRPLCDAFFLADEIGLVKPDPEVFAHACRTLDSVPERTAMVGDRYDRDIIGAHALGLFTVLVDVHAIPLPEGGVRPDAIVPEIGAVLGVLPLGEEAPAGSANRAP